MLNLFVTAGRLCSVRVALVLGVAAVASLVDAAPLAGQLDVRAGVSVGSLNGRGSLPNAPILDDPGAVVTYDEFATRPHVAAKVEVRSAVLPLAVRLSLVRSRTGDETGVWGCGLDIEGNPVPCPSILIEVPTDVTATIASAGVVGDVPVGPVTLHPSIGVAVHRWSYRWSPDPVGSFSLASGAFTDDLTGILGGVGASVPLGRVRVEAEYQEYRGRSAPARPSRTRTMSFGVSTRL